MPYKVTITRIDNDVKYIKKSWEKLRDDEEKDPSGENQLYGYVKTESTRDETTEIFEQTVDVIDIQAVVGVINNIPVSYPVPVMAGEEDA